MQLLHQAWQKIGKVIADLGKVLKESNKVYDKALEKQKSEEVSAPFNKAVFDLNECIKVAEATEVCHIPSIMGHGETRVLQD